MLGTSIKLAAPVDTATVALAALVDDTRVEAAEEALDELKLAVATVELAVDDTTTTGEVLFLAVVTAAGDTTTLELVTTGAELVLTDDTTTGELTADEDELLAAEEEMTAAEVGAWICPSEIWVMTRAEEVVEALVTVVVIDVGAWIYRVSLVSRT